MSIRFWIIIVMLLPVLTGCAARMENRPGDQRLVLVSESDKEPGRFPFFLLSEWQRPYNRIGRVQAERHGAHERVFIDPEQAVVYRGRFSFTSDSGNSYINQVFRVHFAKVPFSLIPFHLGAGSNIGLLVVITRDSRNYPLLVTTVNTCGCYAAVIPTSYLPAEAYPPDWPVDGQRIYGELLPTVLDMTEPDAGLLVTIRPGVQRVMDVQVVGPDILPAVQRVYAGIQPLSALKSLPLFEGRVTSMYYDHWPLKGHVKGALKPWESLLLSLVSLDLYVGMDKEYDGTGESGNPFYTSLKPWNRTSSDMNDFASFLRFYGWKL